MQPFYPSAGSAALLPGADASPGGSTSAPLGFQEHRGGEGRYSAAALNDASASKQQHSVAMTHAPSAAPVTGFTMGMLPGSGMPVVLIPASMQYLIANGMLPCHHPSRLQHQPMVQVQYYQPAATGLMTDNAMEYARLRPQPQYSTAAPHLANPAAYSRMDLQQYLTHRALDAARAAAATPPSTAGGLTASPCSACPTPGDPSRTTSSVQSARPPQQSYGAFSVAGGAQLPAQQAQLLCVAMPAGSCSSASGGAGSKPPAVECTVPAAEASGLGGFVPLQAQLLGQDGQQLSDGPAALALALDATAGHAQLPTAELADAPGPDEQAKPSWSTLTESTLQHVVRHLRPGTLNIFRQVRHRG